MVILAWAILSHGFQYINIPNNFPNSNHSSCHNSHHNSNHNNNHNSNNNNRCNSSNSNRYRIYMVFLLLTRLQGVLQIEITLA